MAPVSPREMVQREKSLADFEALQECFSAAS